MNIVHRIISDDSSDLYVARPEHRRRPTKNFGDRTVSPWPTIYAKFATNEIEEIEALHLRIVN